MSNIDWVSKDFTTPLGKKGDIDVLLKDGTKIECKHSDWFVTAVAEPPYTQYKPESSLGKLRDQILKLKEYSEASVKVSFKEGCSNSVKTMVEFLGANIY